MQEWRRNRQSPPPHRPSSLRSRCERQRWPAADDPASAADLPTDGAAMALVEPRRALDRRAEPGRSLAPRQFQARPPRDRAPVVRAPWPKADSRDQRCRRQQAESYPRRPRATTAIDRLTTDGRAAKASGAPGSRRAKAMSTPMAASEAIKDEPPDDTSGKGTPVTGARPTTTAMLMHAWPTIHAPTPAAAICTNGSV